MMRILAVLGMILGTFGSVALADAGQMLAGLASPPRECTQVPFWFWNGPLEPEVFREQLREMADKGVYAAMPHPRFGMDRRQYLEEPFWDAMTATIDEAKRLGMQIWLYDEYNWPSGGAGGRVTDGHPELYPRGLDYRVYAFADGPRQVTIQDLQPTETKMERFERIVRGFIKGRDESASAYRRWGQVSDDGGRITGQIDGTACEVLVFFQALGRNPSVLDHGSNSMTDYLSREPAERFIELTHNEYFRRFGKDFGGVIPAIFTDECSTTSPAPFPWTERLPEEFHRRYGVNIMDKLPLLLDSDSADGARLRMAYWQTVTDLFEDGFLGEVQRWCGSHELGLTGHIYEENIGSYAHSGQLMQLLRGMQEPGFDALGPRSSPHMSKVAISTAQLEGKTSLCECLGLAGGWNCTLGMLRTGYNVLGSLGVARFVPHAFFQTVENPRVECPPDFFLTNPYWKYYRRIADLSGRLSYFNRLGRHVAPAAVYYPIESLWADSVGGKGQNVLPWQHRTEGNEQASRTAKVFNEVLDGMFRSRWDLDVVDEGFLAEAEVVNSGAGVQLQIGNEEFRVLVVPPVTAIGARSLQTIDAFLQAGGLVIWLERFPEYTWPQAQDEPAQTLQKWFGDAGRSQPGQAVRVGRGRLVLLHGDPSAVVEYLNEHGGPEVKVSGGLDAVTVTHRQDRAGDYLLLFNDSDDFVSGTISLAGMRMNAPVLVDLDTGRPYRGAASGGELALEMRPRQSVCAVFAAGAVESGMPLWRIERPAGRALDLGDGWIIQPVGSALDNRWSDRTGETTLEVPLFRVKHREFSDVGDWTHPDFDDSNWDRIHVLRENGLFTDNSAILLRAQLPPGTRAIQMPLPVTGECAVWVNGQLLEKHIGPAEDEQRWLPLGEAAGQAGAVLAIETYSHSAAAGLTAPVKVLCGPCDIGTLRPWNEMALDWYAGRVLCRRQVDVPEDARGVWLDLGRVQHYAEVWVNGSLVDTLLWPPYELDITEAVRPGENEITLIVANSIANRFAWDVWGTRGGANPDPSGILGPVVLWVE